MKGSTATLIVVGVLAISYLPYVTLSMPTTSNDGTFQLNYIGSADGKSLFTEKDQRMNWTQAGQFCNSSSMRLASLTSVAQQNVLKNAVNFTGGYWTGGRDSRTHGQFAWEFNEVPLNATLAGPISYFNPVQTCLYYEANLGYKNLRAVPCTNLLGALCEVTV